MNEQLGAWSQTRSGRAWYLENPRAQDVDIHDIAHALSNLCRFGGHSMHFYSVAEHAVLVSRWLEAQNMPTWIQYQGLHHDDTEAYVVDVPRPLKNLLGKAYSDIEDRTWRAIADALSIEHEEYNLHPAVKAADNEVLLAERAVMMGIPPIPWGWDEGITPACVDIKFLPAEAAKLEFLRRHRRLVRHLAAQPS